MMTSFGEQTRRGRKFEYHEEDLSELEKVSAIGNLIANLRKDESLRREILQIEGHYLEKRTVAASGTSLDNLQKRELGVGRIKEKRGKEHTAA
jgi:hypothetical protein